MTELYKKKEVESLLEQNKNRQEIKNIMLEKYNYVISLKRISKINKEIKERSVENFCRKIEQILQTYGVMTIDDWIKIRNLMYTPSKIFITKFPNDLREIRRDVSKTGNIIRLLKDGEQYYLEMLVKHSISTAKLRSINDYNLFLKDSEKDTIVQE